MPDLQPSFVEEQIIIVDQIATSLSHNEQQITELTAEIDEVCGFLFIHVSKQLFYDRNFAFD